MDDLDCPLLEPLSPAVRTFYEERARARQAWADEIDRKIAEVEWARKHPEEAARRMVERHGSGASPAGSPMVEWAPDRPDAGNDLQLLNLCDPSPCMDAQDAIAHLSWGARVAVASESLATLVGAPAPREVPSPPVAYNGGRWMAVDTQGRAFVVHVRGDRIRLLIFDAANPSSVIHDRLIDPSTVDRDTTKVASPCIALSQSSGGTVFTIAFLASPTQALKRLYVTRGRLSWSGRRLSLTTQRVAQVSDGTYANPSVFHDNLNVVHLVVAYVSHTLLFRVPAIVWFSTPWAISSFAAWRALLSANGPALSDMPLGFPSVAARWADGELTVVVACKFSGSAGTSGVYVNAASGSSISTLRWTGWTFLAGVDVATGAPGFLSAGDPSVWVNTCGRFYLGYHEQVMGSVGLDLRPVLCSNPDPEASPTSWRAQMLLPSARGAQYVQLAGSEDFAFAVWEAREIDATGVELKPTWACALGVHSTRSMGPPNWGIVEPTAGWGLDLSVTGPDWLLYPTCCVTGDALMVAWFYIDRTQVTSPPNALSLPGNWRLYPGAQAEIFFTRGVIRCP